MKAKLLLLTSFCLIFFVNQAQTVTRIENFNNYVSGTSYSGIPVGENQISWNLTDVVATTPLGGIELSTKTSIATATVPFGITGTASFTATNTGGQAADISILIDGDVQETVSVAGGTTSETFNIDIVDVQSGLFSLSIANTSNAANRAVAINDLTWNGYTSIFEIQYTTTPGISGTYPSPVVGSSFTVYGTVTGVKPGVGYYIYDTDGAWNGIYVADASLSPSVQDIVSVSGTVVENGGRTEISASSSSLVEADGGVAPVSTLIVSPLSEKDESVVSYITYSRYATGSLGNLYMNIGFSAPLTPIKVDNDLYTMNDPNVDNLYAITGPVNFSASEFSLSPRDIADITDEGVITNDIATQSVVPSIQSTFNNIVVEYGQTYSMQIFNLAGQRVKEINGVEGRTEINVEKGVYIVKLNSANASVTEKVLVK